MQLLLPFKVSQHQQFQVQLYKSPIHPLEEMLQHSGWFLKQIDLNWCWLAIQIKIIYVFSFVAVDSQAAATINTTNVQICDCNRLDIDNQCLFDTALLAVNPNVQIVQCKCSQYYIGKIDY